MECHGKLGHGGFAHVHSHGSITRPFRYRQPTDDQLCSVIWRTPRGLGHHRDGNRTFAGSNYRHHRRVSCTTGAARSTGDDAAGLRQIFCRRHGLRSRHARHIDSTQHHAGAYGRPHVYECRRPFPRRSISRRPARRPLYSLYFARGLAVTRKSPGSAYPTL